MADWGISGTPQKLAETAAELGYDGIEVWWPRSVAAQSTLAATTKSVGGGRLSLLAGSVLSDPEAHGDEIEEQLREIRVTGIDPLHVTLHLGRDHWPLSVQHTLLERVADWRRTYDIDVLVETHRGRILNSAFSAAELLPDHEGVRVAFDVSHWLVVSESYLDDQRDAVSLGIARADHVHARIGHAQGPQVIDPEHDCWAGLLDRYFGWWDRIVARLEQDGKPVTFLAEFGPVPYAPSLAGRAVRDHAEVNAWMLQRLRERYGSAT
ncbi:sugar phosphate isomerase/epimerase family protein [Microbacterium oxydans]|uniref:sugar phosphate isomerase/epimerase family protein n=1 Tax=Microbacterium oxydans TaxID=82380 RepID=UPI00366B6B6B